MILIYFLNLSSKESYVVCYMYFKRGNKCPLCQNYHKFLLTKSELVWEWHTSIDSLEILRTIIHENKINDTALLGIPKVYSIRTNSSCTLM